MKNRIITVLFILLHFHFSELLACDICGGFMGVTPYDNQSSIAFMHRYRCYNGYRLYHQASHIFPAGAYKTMHGGSGADGQPIVKTYSSKDYESYKVYELRAKYFIHSRVELNLFLPLNQNKSKTDSIVTEHIGLGDPSFFVGYHLIRPNPDKKIRQRLISGLGIKMPLGNYYAHDQFSNRIPLLLQPGTGSWDAFTYLNYIMSYRQFGLNVNIYYKYNGQNTFRERIANSTTEFLSLFYRQKWGDFVIMPSVQCFYEYTKGLYIKKVHQSGTEMNNLMIGPGIDLFYKNISLSCSFQFNAWEKVADDDLRSAGRMVLGLSYNFKQRKYLIK